MGVYVVLCNVKKKMIVIILLILNLSLGMTTGTNLPGFASQTQIHEKYLELLRKLILVTGLKFYPNPYPSG